MTDNGGEVRIHAVGVYERPETEEAEPRLPVLLLRDELGREFNLPIGSCDGLAIHIALTQQQVSRPLTHDLALRLLERLEGRLERVVIDAYGEEGCHATLLITSARGAQLLTARAGDAVALALRADLPMFATEDVLAQVGRPGETL